MFFFCIARDRCHRLFACLILHFFKHISVSMNIMNHRKTVLSHAILIFLLYFFQLLSIDQVMIVPIHYVLWRA